MADLVFSVPGDPVSKGRPRVGKNANVYTPRRTKDAEERIGWAAKGALPPGTKIEDAGIFGISILFRVRGQGQDIDNLVKTVLDALTGVVWKNDRQIQDLGAMIVRNSPDPGTDVRVWRISDE